MKSENLFEEIGNIDEKFVAEADTRPAAAHEKARHYGVGSSFGQNNAPSSPASAPGRKFSRRAAWGAAAAACVVLLAAAGMRYHITSRNLIELSEASVNVTARYADTIPNLSASSADLVYLTEEQIFQEYDTAIFKGTIQEIRNIVLDYNGQKNYQAVAQIQVEKVYRGDCSAGDTLTVLLPCPIMEGYWVEDTDTVSAFRTGLTGIFMPVQYDDSYYCSMNNATLMYRDIADYGFFDGTRWAFLETEDGLVYAKWTYESLTGASTLEDVEAYIYRMLDTE